MEELRISLSTTGIGLRAQKGGVISQVEYAEDIAKKSSSDRIYSMCQ